MPLFGWMKWTWGKAESKEAGAESKEAGAESKEAGAESKEAGAESKEAGAESKEAGAESSCVLMHELLRYMEERQRVACDMERQHQQTQGMMGYRRVQSYPTTKPPVPPSERQALECLCARIRPANTATALSRCREVLTAHNILPWELVYVFKQVLRDFLDEEEGTSPFQVKWGTTVPTAPNCSETPRQEIPTISSYVDRRMRGVCPYQAPRDWDLPYGYPGPI